MVNIDKKLNNLLKKFLPKFLKALKIDWEVGSAISISNAKISGKKTNMNPLKLYKKDQEANIKIISELVKGVNDDMSKKINNLVNQSVTEKWSNKQLSEQLKGIFDKESPNYFNYKDRFDNIAQTESARIMNTSSNNTAKRLGAKKKYLLNPMDGKTGEDSKISQKKYGTPEKAILFDKEFRYTFSGKERVFMFPPDRPRDRSIPLYIFE